MIGVKVSSLLIGCLAAYAVGVLTGSVLVVVLVSIVWIAGITFGSEL